MEVTKSQHTHADFPVGSQAKVCSEVVDFTFFDGQEGTVIKNTGGYLGIILLFPDDRQFNFNPSNLVPLEQKRTEITDALTAALERAERAEALVEEAATKGDLAKVQSELHALIDQGAAVIAEERDALMECIRALATEVNCRREHGADGAEHLLYIECELRKMLDTKESQP